MHIYKNHIVNDMAWAVLSPPLLVLKKQESTWFDNDFYKEQESLSKTWFSELDENPAIIKNAVDLEKDKRLGNYFEVLWAEYIKASIRYELIERNLQIFDGGKTIGELDFIVLDKVTNKMMHWELAVKFYLGAGDTRCANNWHGPNKKDRLDLKVNHLVNNQLQLSKREITQGFLATKNIIIDSSAVILKGRLFYPSTANTPPENACLNHCRGRWLTLDQIKKEFSSDLTFYPLINEGWMASLNKIQNEDIVTLEQVMSDINEGTFRLPLLLAVIKDGIEQERLFVVKNDWFVG